MEPPTATESLQEQRRATTILKHQQEMREGLCSCGLKSLICRWSLLASHSRFGTCCLHSAATYALETTELQNLRLQASNTQLSCLPRTHAHARMHVLAK
ncbi:hypothetical protein DUNSADRAFT_11016 [Dunaliella salina]|uniref:Encoded protein n=1 Tax=Dunaliella salina TaxID=3046 RepID=A0ABQ7GEA2_DUNSA|nr:hypothetical protein DUNSADRAFT_11016 [Dunaliella salina]|eukprot:KAF5832936.1 hypothetical protein DUNSADRAFT_11016 [Dunaliella salina]